MSFATFLREKTAPDQDAKSDLPCSGAFLRVKKTKKLLLLVKLKQFFISKIKKQLLTKERHLEGVN